MGIDKNRNQKNAFCTADVGALVLWKLTKRDDKVNFVNGMAANDPVSTKEIWKFVIEKYLNANTGTAVFFQFSG